MIQIRNSVFETNSSSTHSICISKKPIDVYSMSHIDFEIGDFGWEEGEAYAPDYLYTAILTDHDKYSERLEHLKDVLDAHGITYTFETPKWVESVWDGEVHTYLDWDCGSIDHDNELEDFLNAVFSDDDLLLRYLFSDTHVYTGSDNCYEDYPISQVANDHGWVKTGDGNDWDKDWEYKFVGNYDHPDYDPDNYDYFFKGN